MPATTPILYLTYDGLTDPLGQSQILPYLIGLCKQDKSLAFHIISFEKPGRFQKEKNIIQDIIQSYNIVWHPLTYTKKPPILSTVKDILTLNRLSEKLHQQHRFKAVHCRSYITALTGLRLKQKFNIKFIFDMRGFWADERVDGNLWNINNPVYKQIYRYFKTKEKLFLQHADAVISLTHAAKKEMLTWNIPQLTEQKITVIPCAADFNHFNPEKIPAQQKTSVKKQLNIPEDTFILTYLGSIGTWYMLDEMLDFFHTVKQKIPNSIFLFITPDDKNLILRKASQKHISENSLRIVSAARSDVPKLLSVSNLGVFFIQPLVSKTASSPVKMGEFLAMNIPVITNHIGDNFSVLKNVGLHTCIDEFSVESYQRAFQNIQISPPNLRQKAESYFSLLNGIKKYHEIYRTLLLNEN